MEDTRRLHFTLSAEAARALRRSGVVKQYRKGRARHTRHVDTYFDTARQALRRARLELKVSQKGQERLQVVRALEGFPGASEWRLELGEEAPGVDRIVGFPEELRRRRWDERLERVFTASRDRTTIGLEKDGTEMDLAIDSGHLAAESPDGPAIAEISEATLTLVSGDGLQMTDLALELIENNALRLWHQPIGVRGYALGRPSRRPSAQKAKHVILSHQMSVGRAFAASVEAALLHLFANEIPTLEGHPDGIHQSRVSIRRLRAVLLAFRKALPSRKRKAFNREFRSVLQSLGPARDWHVFVDETIPQMVRDGVDAELIARLRRIARAERAGGSRSAAESLRSRGFSRLQLQFERWLAELRRDPAGELTKAIGPFARSVLEKTRSDLLVDTRPLSRMSPLELHALRIRGKKARYAGEFFRALFRPERCGPQLLLLSRFQDRLGETNDASVARQILTPFVPNRLSDEMIRTVDEWSGARIRACALAGQPEWRRLQRLEPYWRRGAEAR